MTGRKDLFEESMQLGHSAAWEKDWDRAIEFYRKALAEIPDQPDALSNLGLALYETNRIQESLAVYNRASKASPEDPIPIEKCAEIFEQLGQKRESIAQREAAAERYMRRKDAEKAIENWVHIARLSPATLSIRSRLALAFERLGRRREAVHEFLAVSSILQRAGKADSAMEAAKRALGLVPGDPEASKYLRLLREDNPLPSPTPPLGSTRPLKSRVVTHSPADAGILEDVLEGEVEVTKTELADPEVAASEQALSLLAELLFEEPEAEDGDEPESLGVNAIAKGLSRSDREAVGRPSMYRYLSQAIDLHLRDQKNQSKEEFQRAIRAGLEHPAAHYVLGLQLKEMRQLDQAKTHLMEARGHPDLALGANLALGRISRQRGDMGDAARHLVQALRLADSLTVDEDQSSQLNQLYDTILAQTEGEREVDEKDLSRIVENTLEFLTGPEWLQRILQAREQLQDQQTDATVVPIAEMLAVGGSDRVVQAVGRIDNLVETGHLIAAMEEAMLALTYAPSFLGLHRRMAEIMLRDGRKEMALDKLRVIADTHGVRGEGRQAVETFQKMLQISPVDVDTRSRLIHIMIQQDRIEEAVSQYLELSELYRHMARIDLARQTLADGLKVSQRAGVDPVWTLRILNQIGEIDLAHLDWRRALEAYDQVLQINPTDEQALATVIDLNLRLGKETEAGDRLDSYLEHLVQNQQGAKALEFLEELVREHPGKQILHASLAEAYRAAGRKADAIAQYDALGEIQLDAGQIQETVQTIQTIIEMEPPDVEGYKELLRNLEAGD